MIFFMEIATVKAEATTRTGLQDTDRHRHTQPHTDRHTRTRAHACTHTTHTNTHILMAVQYVKHIQGK